MVTNVLAGGDVIQIAAIVKTFTIPMYSQPSIKEVAQLKGQKVAVSRFGSISHIAAQNIFQKAGITGVTVVQSGGTPESAAMLMSGNVVAAMVPPPQSLILKEKGFRELVSVKQFREWNIPVVENGVAARRSFIEKNPTVAKRFIRAAFEGFDRVLGILSLRRAEEAAPPVPVEEIEQLIADRQAARRRRDFAASDKIRDELLARGIILEDSAAGTRWKRK